MRVRLAGILAITTVLAAGCSDESGSPTVTIAAGDAKTSVKPTLYCVGGSAQLADEKQATAALQVKPDTKVRIDVPAEVAKARWTIQIWSVNDLPEGSVPLEQIGNIDAGNARTFDGFTTSDAVPDRYFVIVAIPEDPKCNAKGSAGLWTVLVARVA